MMNLNEAVDGMTEGRTERLLQAVYGGADDAALTALRAALRTSTLSTIVLPAHRFENLSRGRGWCRRGKGDGAVWGERCDGGYRVGPGKWSVGATDGFKRKGADEWIVKHVTVGSQTWTVAL